MQWANPISRSVQSKSILIHYIKKAYNCLVERVGAGAPVGEEDAEADGLEDAGKGANGDLLKRALLGGDLGNELVVC